MPADGSRPARSAFRPRRAARDPASDDADRGAAISQSPAVQHRAGAGTRHASKLPRRRAPRPRALSRSRASAAVILEQHGFPPLVLSFESIDELDHVLFVYQRRGRWGSVARSRDPASTDGSPSSLSARAGAQLRRSVRGLHRTRDWLHGRRSPSDGRIRLAPLGSQRVEGRAHAAGRATRPIRSSDARIDRLRRRYKEFWRRHGRKPVDYRGRDRWTEIPEGNW